MQLIAPKPELRSTIRLSISAKNFATKRRARVLEIPSAAIIGDYRRAGRSTKIAMYLASFSISHRAILRASDDVIGANCTAQISSPAKRNTFMREATGRTEAQELLEREERGERITDNEVPPVLQRGLQQSSGGREH